MEFITSFGGESDSGAKSSGNEGDNDGKRKRVRTETDAEMDKKVCNVHRLRGWMRGLASVAVTRDHAT